MRFPHRYRSVLEHDRNWERFALGWIDVSRNFLIADSPEWSVIVVDKTDCIKWSLMIRALVCWNYWVCLETFTEIQARHSDQGFSIAQLHKFRSFTLFNRLCQDSPSFGLAKKFPQYIRGSHCIPFWKFASQSWTRCLWREGFSINDQLLIPPWFVILVNGQQTGFPLR
jgi:hypothetical protein